MLYTSIYTCIECFVYQESLITHLIGTSQYFQMKHPRFKSPIPQLLNKKKKIAKNCFGPYIFGSQSIWSLYFGNSQFSPCYFQLATNLIPTINSLTKMPTWLKQCALLAYLMLICLNFSVHISTQMEKKCHINIYKIHFFFTNFILFFIYIFKIFSPFLYDQTDFHFYFLNFYFYFLAISS